MTLLRARFQDGKKQQARERGKGSASTRAWDGSHDERRFIADRKSNDSSLESLSRLATSKHDRERGVCIFCMCPFFAIKNLEVNTYTEKKCC